MLKIKNRFQIFRFSVECRKVLKSNAKSYNGLFTGVYKITTGNIKRAENVINEWYNRSKNCFPDSSMVTLIEKILSCDSEGRIAIANAIMFAAKKVNITKENDEELALNEKNVSAYSEWNGNDLYEGSKVKIISPAWYQNGEIIEQGYCEIIEV